MSLRTLGMLILILTFALGTSSSLAEERSFGKGVSDPEDLLPISELLASPSDYLDETVRVSGAVVGVCKKRGCWMELASDQEFQSLQIKVEDGEIVFPLEILGSVAIAEGVFTALPLTLEQSRNYLKQETECQGGTFDVDSVTEAVTIYRIQGTGALVSEPEAEKVAEKVAEKGEKKAEKKAEDEAPANPEI